MKRSASARGHHQLQDGGGVKMVIFRETEKFCIMILVVVQKPAPVKKFHRVTHKKECIES